MNMETFRSHLKQSSLERTPRAHSKQISVTFVNNCEEDNISIYWLDYDGQEVEYFSDVKPKEMRKVRTYLWHLWIVKNSTTGKSLFFSNLDKVTKHFEIVRFLFNHYEHGLINVTKYKEIVSRGDNSGIFAHVVPEPSLVYWSSASIVKHISTLNEDEESSDEMKKSAMMKKIKQMDIPEHMKPNLGVMTKYFKVPSPCDCVINNC